MALSTKSLLVPATALLATLLLAAKSTSPMKPRRQQPQQQQAARAPAAASPCPSDMAFIRGKFCIDRYEASTVEVRDDGTTAPHSPFMPVARLRVKAVSQNGVVPQAYISRNEAQGACQAAGKRLCTDREWITACKGPTGTKYPYGNERQPGYCVDTDRVAPLSKLFQDLGSKRFLHEPMNDPRLNQVAGTLAPTGSFAQCTNDFKVYDMVGNLHEWTADPKGTFRGGYYLDTHINGDGCNYRTVAHQASYHDYSTGFRCCANPK